MSSPPSQEQDLYVSRHIRIFKGAEHIRCRPAMYIGSTDSAGLNELVFELIYASLRERQVGTTHRLTIEFFRDGGVRVSDDGGGANIETSGEGFVPLYWLVSRRPACHFPIVRGLNEGVGRSAVRALSSHFEIEVTREGRRWRRSYWEGAPLGQEEVLPHDGPAGTSISFWPDRSIFDQGVTFDLSALRDPCRQISFLFPEVEIHLTDWRETPVREDVFRNPAGVADYVRFLNTGREPVHPQIIYFDAREEHQELHLAMQWTKSTRPEVMTFANAVPLPNGGTHLHGFRDGLTRVLKKYARYLGVFRDEKVTGEDCRRGLNAVLSVNLSEPQFECATSSRLRNPEACRFVRMVTEQWFAAFLESYLDEARMIGEHVRQVYESRLARKAARSHNRAGE